MKTTMAINASPTFNHAIIDQSSMVTLLGSGRKGGFDSPMKRNLNRGSSKIEKEAENSSPLCPRSMWIGGDYDSLPEVPLYYPIERTSAVVNSCNPHVIANRLAECLQKLSITTEANSNEASLLAEALDYTKFYIRLYKNDNKGILVELQRVDGDSFNFIKYVRIILASARGEAIDEMKATTRRSSLNYIPAPISSCYSEKSCQEDTNSAYIMQVEDLLSADRSDAVMLGIESLLLLTDKERSQVSLSAAEAVLNGNGHSVIKEFIQKCIHTPHSAFSPADKDFDYASRQCETMHNTALAVLGNSLQTTLDSKSSTMLRSLLQSEEWMGRYGIVDSLLSELSHANDRPHDAYHAARCLNTLLDSNMRMTLIERGLPNAVMASRAVGRTRHSLLARECEAALIKVSLDRE